MKKTIFIIAGILLIILVAGGVYFWQKNKVQKNWAVYKNTGFGINLNHPSDWKTKNFENNSVRFYSLSKTHNTLLPDEPLDIVIDLDKLANPGKLSLQENYDKDYQSCLNSGPSAMGCPHLSTSGLREIMVNGKKALRGVSETPEGPAMESLFIIYPDYFLVLKGFSYYPNEHPEFKTLFDEVVASINLAKL